jgi:uncharacterized protein (DUF1684 family)
MRMRLPLCAILALLAAACEPPPLPTPDPAVHQAEMDAWRAWRRATLMRPDGWLSLVGLFWLREGENTFGSDSSGDFIYPGMIPARVGTFTLRGDSVRFRAANGVPVLAAGDTVVEIDVTPLSGVEATTMELGSVQWLVIRRGDEQAVRVRDAQSSVRTDFSGIDMYPISLEWRLSGRFRWRDPPDTIDVPNFMGGVNRVPSPASVSFEVNGRRRSLDLWKDADDPDNFFTAFADETNGRGTYGGGRFLWIDAPDEQGRTVVDFNASYNPPCVFTPYATCPLPPRQNRLPVEVPAGERNWKQ